MTKSRTILILIIAPALVSLAVTLLVLSVWDTRQASQPRTIVLPTHGSTAMIPPRATRPPISQAGDTEEGENTRAPEPTTPSVACENPEHLVASGETLGVISDHYGVSIDDVITINEMVDPEFNPDFLSVAQVLVIPVCGIPTPTSIGVPTGTSVPTRNIPDPIATTTALPSGSVSVHIVRVFYPGDVTREAVEIVNEGSPVDLAGWRLTNDDEDKFVFPTFKLFTGGGVTVFTGAGENTPVVLYWGLNNAVWNVGYTVFLYDVNGKLQDEFEISE
ncbi:MAG: lamin tail domain-containing protein [Anaerolineae bacterium]|nr:lamin tail domain-containing protein [Anaerolineae bacterium]